MEGSCGWLEGLVVPSQREERVKGSSVGVVVVCSRIVQGEIGGVVLLRGAVLIRGEEIHKRVREAVLGRKFVD